MQTVQFKVDDNYLKIVLTLLDNLKKDIVKELMIIKEDNDSSKEQTDEQMKLDKAKGILKGRISNPAEYQRALRNEWERE